MLCDLGHPQLAFLLYYGGYVLLSLLLALCLVLGGGGAGSAPTLCFGAGAGGRLRATLVGVLGALAGLPPFFFFLPKLGVASLLVGGAHWGATGAAFFLIFLGWYTYYAAASRLLPTWVVWPWQPLRGQRLPCLGAGLLGAAGALLVLGGFFFDDAVLCLLWLLS
jgi:hypothetical protein